MNTDLLLCLMRCAVMGTQVQRVYVIPRDELIKIKVDHLPIAVGFNEQDGTQPGSHWLFLWISKVKDGRVYGSFVDSYGKSWSDYKFPTLKFPVITENNCNLQMYDSSVCGSYAVFLTYYMSRNVDLQKILNRFTCFPSPFNDSIVVRFVKRFRLKAEEQTDCKQSCCSRLHRRN